MLGQEGSTTDFRPSRIPVASNPVDPILGLAELLDTEKGHRRSLLTASLIKEDAPAAHPPGLHRWNTPPSCTSSQHLTSLRTPSNTNPTQTPPHPNIRSPTDSRALWPPISLWGSKRIFRGSQRAEGECIPEY